MHIFSRMTRTNSFTEFLRQWHILKSNDVPKGFEKYFGKGKAKPKAPPKEPPPRGMLCFVFHCRMYAA